MTTGFRFIPPVLAALGLGACGSGAEPRSGRADTAPVAAPSQNSIVTSAHGNARRVFGALSQVQLTPGQRAAVEKIAADAEPLYAATHEAREALVETVAVQVEHGAIDAQALQPRIDALVLAFKQEDAATRVPFLTVGATLSDDQKAAFSAAVHTFVQREHGSLDRSRDQVSTTPPVAPLAANVEPSDRLSPAALHLSVNQWGHQLGLTPEQSGQIKSVARNLRQDSNAASAVAGAALFPTPAAPLGRLIAFLERTVPVLTATQRTVAAQMVRDTSFHPAHAAATL
jgi:hypothetical protein